MTSTAAADTATTSTDPRWAVAGEFIDALTRRDFTALETCLAPDVRFRALVPPGPFELNGAPDTAQKFRTWFGAQPEFAVLDAGVGQIGTKLYLTWRLWCRGEDGVAKTVEQQVYATAADQITAIDLLCSGFQVEDGPDRGTVG